MNKTNRQTTNEQTNQDDDFERISTITRTLSRRQQEQPHDQLVHPLHRAGQGPDDVRQHLARVDAQAPHDAVVPPTELLRKHHLRQLALRVRSKRVEAPLLHEVRIVHVHPTHPVQLRGHVDHPRRSTRLLPRLLQPRKHHLAQQKVAKVIGTHVRLESVPCLLPGRRHAEDTGVVDEHVHGKLDGLVPLVHKLPHGRQRRHIEDHNQGRRGLLPPPSAPSPPSPPFPRLAAVEFGRELVALGAIPASKHHRIASTVHLGGYFFADATGRTRHDAHAAVGSGTGGPPVHPPVRHPNALQGRKRQHPELLCEHLDGDDQRLEEQQEGMSAKSGHGEQGVAHHQGANGQSFAPGAKSFAPGA